MTPEKTQAPIRYPSELIDEEWEILQPISDDLEPLDVHERPIFAKS